jgi:hypothetical protein
MNLKYAAKDARDIAALFKDRGGRYGKVELLQILDGEAKRETILAAREEARGAARSAIRWWCSWPGTGCSTSASTITS